MIPLISFYIIFVPLLFLEIKIKIFMILILEINHISYSDLSDALKYVLLITYLNNHMIKFWEKMGERLSCTNHDLKDFNNNDKYGFQMKVELYTHFGIQW